MPHRDPQTGQFVGSTASQNYTDFDIQQVVTSATSNNTEITDMQQTFDNFNSIEPAGGLARDEVAELVLAIIDVSMAVPTISASGTSTVEIGSEVSADSEPHLLVAMNDGVSESNVDGVTGFDARNVAKVDLDPLYHHTVTGSADSADTTNGVGIGGANSHMQRRLPYRNMFGHGPEFDRHDQINWHLSYQAEGSANPGFRYAERTTLVWDVYDE